MSNLGMVFQMYHLACRPSLSEDPGLQRLDLRIRCLVCVKSTWNPHPEVLAKQLW